MKVINQMPKSEINKQDKQDFAVNILFGFIASSIFAVFAKVFYETNNGADERFFQPFSYTSFGLIILPFIFSFIAAKSASLHKYWIAIFWLTLLFEFIATIAFVFFTAN
ncbi:MAG: hypothetical protein MUC29_01895 [Pyrinomonadaceae bacterium]|jgi:hypothetical protein|nr:hypothetical protein [Pyrinomonadaceae bacterium]